jgi:hypothetical protein
MTEKNQSSKIPVPLDEKRKEDKEIINDEEKPV